ncbi:MAG: glycosyltransferase, partial [Acidimicrobiia bacterium]|nr:glycosyltransferase [Acidimicrobiia bacterium]
MRTPTIGFVGPMLGRNPGWVTTQGELLADRFRAEGWSVLETSSKVGRASRLIDTLTSISRWRGTVDVIVLSVFSGPAFVTVDAASAAASRLGIPLVMVLHGGNLPTHRAQHPRWTGRVLRRADRIVAPSSYLTDAFEEFDVTVLPNLADTETIVFRRRRKATPRILWMRTFHPVYNPELAVRAVALLRNNHPEVHLTMAGQEKGSTSDVLAEIERHALGDVVDVVGFLDRDAKDRAFDAHDIYLHTNRIDNTPVSLLEAAAAGLPIVATCVGGVPSLLRDGTDALLVPSDDPEAMATALGRLLDDPTLADTLSVNGRAIAENSSWPAVRGAWTALFDDVLSRVRPLALPPLRDDPSISVIMPVRNEGRYLERSLRAVLTQDDVETPQVIVVDGASEDGTADLAHRIAAECGTAIQVLNNPQRIVPVSMNLGLAVAKGEVVVRVDGHCVIAPDYLRQCIDALRATGDACVGGPMETIGETDEAASIAAAQSSRVGVGGVAFRTSETAGHVDTLAFGAYRREVFDRIGTFDETLVRNQDDEFNLRMTRAGSTKRCCASWTSTARRGV